MALVDSPSATFEATLRLADSHPSVHGNRRARQKLPSIKGYLMSVPARFTLPPFRARGPRLCRTECGPSATRSRLPEQAQRSLACSELRGDSQYESWQAPAGSDHRTFPGRSMWRTLESFLCASARRHALGWFRTIESTIVSRRIVADFCCDFVPWSYIGLPIRVSIATMFRDGVIVELAHSHRSSKLVTRR
jgi:hypothetical protein